MSEQPNTAWSPLRVLAWVFLYALVTLLTRARLMGDTLDYIREVVAYDQHIWEFGHLLWVPAGWLFSRPAEWLGVDTFLAARATFRVINWLAGLASVLLVDAWLLRLQIRPLAATLATLTLLFAQAFLNHAQTGNAYVPGLAFVLLALYLGSGKGVGRGLLSGVAQGLAVCCWFPYVLVVPAVLTAGCLQGVVRWPALLWGAIGFALGAGGPYAAAAYSLGITDLAGVMEWMAAASHGAQISGVVRAAFGLAQSFIYLGEEGVLFKRFLLRDSYNPVTAWDLFRLGLWKIAFFYLALGCILLDLLFDCMGRRRFVVFLLAAVPVVGFGIFWQGGDLERYLPLFPFLLLCLGQLLTQTGPRLAQVIAACFVVVLVVVNGLGQSRSQIDAAQEKLLARVAEVRQQLGPESRLFIASDPLRHLQRSYLLAPPEQALHFVEVARPGQASTPLWRQEFAEQVEKTWAAGGEVWLANWLRQPRPHRESSWAEGDDPRISWQDVAEFFASLEIDRSLGGPDGFVRIKRSEKNENQLRQFLSRP